MAATHKREETSSWTTNAATMLRGGIFGGIVALLVTAATAAFCYVGLLPVGAGKYAAITAALMGAFVAGGYAARRMWTAPGIWAGGTAGAIVFLLLLSLGVILYRTAPQTESVITGLLPCLCGGSLAGVLLAKPRKKRRR